MPGGHRDKQLLEYSCSAAIGFAEVDRDLGWARAVTGPYPASGVAESTPFVWDFLASRAVAVNA